MSAEVDKQREIVEIMAAADRAERGSDYVESGAVKFDAQLISGTRYRIRLSETEPER